MRQKLFRLEAEGKRAGTRLNATIKNLGETFKNSWGDKL